MSAETNNISSIISYLNCIMCIYVHACGTFVCTCLNARHTDNASCEYICVCARLCADECVSMSVHVLVLVQVHLKVYASINSCYRANACMSM